MGDVINLNRFRKNKQREEARRRADENAIRKGRRRADRLKESFDRKRAEEKLDGAILQPPDDGKG